jgi:predicted Zn-dependent protease
MPFSLQDKKHLSAAQGYFELGMLADSETELDKLSRATQERPEVLVIRLGIYQKQERWPELQVVSAALSDLDPAQPQWAISLAYATRRADCIESARAVLLNALKRHPKEALIHFNLACYECQLGNPAGAIALVKTALLLDPAMAPMALTDPDLEPIREHLRKKEFAN